MIDFTMLWFHIDIIVISVTVIGISRAIIVDNTDRSLTCIYSGKRLARGRIRDRICWGLRNIS